MRAVIGLVGADEVVFGDLEMHLGIPVRKSGAERPVDLAGAIAVRRKATEGRVIHIVLCEQPFEQIEVAIALHAFE
ncbi:hypothetical protein D3C86_1914770 [compost metagenome]